MVTLGLILASSFVMAYTQVWGLCPLAYGVLLPVFDLAMIEGMCIAVGVVMSTVELPT